MDRAGVFAAADRIDGDWGRIDILFNNHGINVTDRTWSAAALDQWDDVIDINIKYIVLLEGILYRYVDVIAATLQVFLLKRLVKFLFFVYVLGKNSETFNFTLFVKKRYSI